MKKIIITIIVLVVLGVGAFMYIESASENNLKDFANSIEQNPSAQTNNYTLADVSLHAVKSDCWMIIDKDVLDVTKFIDMHPGGQVIVQGCGKDATGYFKGVREHMKPIVKTLAQKMVIGKLAE